MRRTGASTTYTRTGDSGGKITYHFCPRCGATVWYVVDAQPGIIAVPVGAFADPQFPPPTVAVYCDREHPWLTLDEAIERHD